MGALQTAGPLRPLVDPTFKVEQAAVTLARYGPGAPALAPDDLALAAPPRFSPTNPMPWVSHRIMRISEPLGIDGRYAVGGLVTGKIAGNLVQYGYVGREALLIQRNQGLRAFAAEAGVRGVAREAGKAMGKGWVISMAITGVCLAGGTAAGYIAYQTRKQPPGTAGRTPRT